MLNKNAKPIYGDSSGICLVAGKESLVVPVKASGTITGSVGVLDFDADVAGEDGNDIQVVLVDGGTAGSESVVVSGSVITVTMDSGVSTAAQLKTAIDAEADAAALVDVTTTTGGAMEAASVTLSGGLGNVESPSSVGIASIKVTGAGEYEISLRQPAFDILHYSLKVSSKDGTDLGIVEVVLQDFDGIAAKVQSKSVFKVSLLDDSDAEADILADGILSFLFVTKSRDVKF